MAEPGDTCPYCRGTRKIRRLDTATYSTIVRPCYVCCGFPEWVKVPQDGDHAPTADQAADD